VSSTGVTSGIIDVRDDPSHPDRTLVTISLATMSAGLEE